MMHIHLVSALLTPAAGEISLLFNCKFYWFINGILSRSAKTFFHGVKLVSNSSCNVTRQLKGTTPASEASRSQILLKPLVRGNLLQLSSVKPVIFVFEPKMSFNSTID